MSKAYEHIEDEPMMAGEPNMALKYNKAPQQIVVTFPTNRDDISEAISGEELKNRLHQSLYTAEELETHLQESELEFESGRFLTMEEADRDMECFINSL